MHNRDLELEYGAALQDSAYFEYAECALLRVSGNDRAPWLHKLVTADVQDLSFGQGARSALLDVKGHFVAVFTVIVRAEEILLSAEPSLRQPLNDSLRRYLFREKVKIADPSDEFAVFSVIGPHAQESLERIFSATISATPWDSLGVTFDNRPALVIRSDSLSAPCFDVLIQSDQRESFKALLRVPPLQGETIEILRVEAGTPRWGTDIDETILALEAPRGLNIRIDQGCYVGQEVVARIVHRGHVNRNFVGLGIPQSKSLPNVHDRIFDPKDNQKEIGIVTSVVSSPTFGDIALGYVRREYADPGGNRAVDIIGEISARAQIVDLPFHV